MLDNNSPRTAIYPGYQDETQVDWYVPPTGKCGTTKESTITEEGLTIRGYECRDTVCIGSWVTGLELDPHTTVCNTM